MNRDNFSALTWFNESNEIDENLPSAGKKAATLPPFQRRLKHIEKKNLENYLVQGWSGQSLSSKKYFKALSHLETLQKDLLQTLKVENFPPKHLNAIFNEYKTFLQHIHVSEPTTLNLVNFSQLLKEIGSEQNILNEFVNYYSARLIMLYFLQLRLLKTLQVKLANTDGMKDLLSPPLALNKIFAKGTNRELHAKSLETNQYSWYRPAEVRLPQVHMLYSLSTDLSFPETLKLLYALQKIKTNTTYSHALSHLGCGLLVNCLQVNLPKWFRNQSAICEVQHQEITVESSLYTGDYLEELAVSHWLAQDNNKNFAWGEILCPHFSNEIGARQGFNFYYHELQLLQLLSEIQIHYPSQPLEFIVRTFTEWQKNLDTGLQRDLFDEVKFLHSQKYDHVVLSVLQNAKNNPHHHLIQKITHAAESLKEGKYLFVLSNQNLFIPSQSDKVDSLLKSLMPQCIIDFSKLKGKGETPDYIYVFKKKMGLEKSYSTSQTCNSFRFHGQIETYQNFCFVPEVLNNFFQKFLTSTPTLYKSPLSEKLPFEFDFFQNAIVNGVLLHSYDQDGQHITHPNFLKKLLNNAMPLNYFFEIQHIDGKNLILDIPNWNIEQKLPMPQPNSFDINEYSEFSLMLDMRDPLQPKLELLSSHLLKIKAYENGISECYYYNLRPKFKKISMRLFREYTRSNLGKQICAISLLGNKNQIRSKISSLLVPNLLIKCRSVPTSISGEEFNVQKIQNFLNQPKPVAILSEEDIVETIEKFSHSKDCLEHLIAVAQMEKDNLKEFNFNSPEVKNHLLKTKLYPLYPNNAEINVDFTAHDIHRTNNLIEKHELVFDPIESKINLISKGSTIAIISGSTPLIIFIHFILRQIPPMKTLDILTNIKVPSAFDCSAIIQLKELELKKLSNLNTSCTNAIEGLLHQGITR